MQARVEIHYRYQGDEGELATYLTGILLEDGSVKVESTLRKIDRIPAGTLLRPASRPAHLTQAEIVLLDPADEQAMGATLAAWDGIARVAVAG